MKCSTLASVTSILSIIGPALALDGYTCLGQNVKHSLLMGCVNTHYHTFLQQFPTHEFFRSDDIVVPFDVTLPFAGHNDPYSRIRISFRRTKKIIKVEAIVSGQIHECQPVANWS
ncbi:Bgt-20375 [Blumeria graminis f. sp. tritici]|uniref:Bgt-20375 n=2 Tax=Blumeria graminis f. sp. tritici TaxID=62690 RepID=A0A9X9QG87_BLUGR|nr:Bgt-20375 [Blumeria graminis f. sp. tritici]